MIRVLLVVVGLLAFVSTAEAQAQHPACKTEGQTKVFGCLDRINWDPNSNIIYKEAVNFLFGWSLVCATSQQASYVEVWVSGPDGATRLTADQFAVAWRGWRPDVANAYRRTCNITGPYWGYTIVIFPDVIPPATQRISVRFYEPSQGVGVNDQERQITVRSVTR